MVEAYDSEYPGNGAQVDINIDIIRLGVVNQTTDVTISENTGTYKYKPALLTYSSIHVTGERDVLFIKLP